MASTGKHKAPELRDGDSCRFESKGMLAAVDHVQTIIAPELTGIHTYRKPKKLALHKTFPGNRPSNSFFFKKQQE